MQLTISRRFQLAMGANKGFDLDAERFHSPVWFLKVAQVVCVVLVSEASPSLEACASR